MKATGLRFDTFYSDGSGIEESVRYECSRDGRDAEVVIEHVADVRFPIARLPWLIDALSRIRAELDESSSKERP